MQNLIENEISDSIYIAAYYNGTHYKNYIYKYYTIYEVPRVKTDHE